MTTTGAPPLLRRINSGLVLDELLRAGPRRVTELVESTGLSRPTIESIVDDLVGLGWLTETVFEPGMRRGRPARELAFRADGGAVLGADIGVRRVTVVLADVAGEIRGEASVEVSPELPARERVDVVGDLARSVSAGFPPGSLMRAVVGTPGIVDTESGVVTQCNLMPGWSGLGLAEGLTTSLGVPVRADNDANLAAIGERWRGVARGVRDMVFVLAGERLGAGIVVGDTIVRGYAGGAGEMGFTNLFDTDPGSEGIGALARLAGGEGLAGLLASGGDDRESGQLLRALAADDPRQVNAELLLDAARMGDAFAVGVLEGIIARVARAVAVLATILNPEVIVIGGAVADAAGEIVDPLRRHLAGMTLLPTRIEASALGHRAVALGAVWEAAEAARATLVDTPAPRAIPA